MKDLEQAARELAARGKATVARVAAIAEQARELLETEDIHPIAPPEREPYAWEASEDFQIGAPARVYVASVEDFATGEGLTVSFFAGRAPSENAFRRSIALKVGAHFANAALIGEGSGARVPFGKMFMSPALSARLKQIERGEDQPPAFDFFARWHVNYS